ncbi:MAG: hypothetical protein ACUVQ8_07340 [Nitrososphaeria archaeon]
MYQAHRRLVFFIIVILGNGLAFNSLNNQNGTAEDAFEDLANRFLALAEKIISIVKVIVAQISRIAYTLVGMVGVLLYFSRFNKRIGIDLIKGAVILAVIVEVVFPFLT